MEFSNIISETDQIKNNLGIKSDSQLLIFLWNHFKSLAKPDFVSYPFTDFTKLTQYNLDQLLKIHIPNLRSVKRFKSKVKCGLIHSKDAGNNLTHILNIFVLIYTIVQNGKNFDLNFSESDYALMYYLSLLHDDGEIFLGDIDYEKSHLEDIQEIYSGISFLDQNNLNEHIISYILIHGITKSYKKISYIDKNKNKINYQFNKTKLKNKLRELLYITRYLDKFEGDLHLCKYGKFDRGIDGQKLFKSHLFTSYLPIDFNSKEFSKLFHLTQSALSTIFNKTAPL